MDTQVHERLTALEEIIAEIRHGLRPTATGRTSSNAAPSVDISSDQKQAIGQNGLEIEYRGSDSCPYGRSATQNKRAFEAVVLHHTADDQSTDWYVQYQINGDPGRGGHHFGYHFYISPAGEIIQGAPLTKRTNHVKRSEHAKRYPFGRHANNTNTIGVSCVGAGKPTFQPTLEQVSATELLVPALCAAFDIDRDHVYGHGEIQSDRHSSEGASIAKTVRAGTLMLTAFSGPNDDLDDYPIHEMTASEAPSLEDADDLDTSAIIWHTDVPSTTVGTAATQLRYTNQSAIRNRKCTEYLEQRLVEAVEAVYGSGCAINIYSGGQDRKGTGSRRTGSIRHDDYGSGGRAADVHVFEQTGRQIKALELAILGQYWLASGFGCVGHEMKGGGIHLDEWTPPPSGGGRFWTYAHSNNLPWGPTARQMLERGAQGIFP